MSSAAALPREPPLFFFLCAKPSAGYAVAGRPPVAAARSDRGGRRARSPHPRVPRWQPTSRAAGGRRRRWRRGRPGRPAAAAAAARPGAVRGGAAGRDAPCQPADHGRWAAAAAAATAPCRWQERRQRAAATAVMAWRRRRLPRHGRCCQCLGWSPDGDGAARQHGNRACLLAVGAGCARFVSVACA